MIQVNVNLAGLLALKDGNLIEDVSKLVKILSLDKVLKTARRCSLSKNRRPGLTSLKKIRTNCSWSHACFDKFSNLTKEKEHDSNDASLSEDMNTLTSLNEKNKSFSKDDVQSANEFSTLDKSEGKSAKGHIILDTDARALSKRKYKETRKRSLYELTIKGNIQNFLFFFEQISFK